MHADALTRESGAPFLGADRPGCIVRRHPPPRGTESAPGEPSLPAGSVQHRTCRDRPPAPGRARWALGDPPRLRRSSGGRRAAPGAAHRRPSRGCQRGRLPPGLAQVLRRVRGSGHLELRAARQRRAGCAARRPRPGPDAGVSDRTGQLRDRSRGRRRGDPSTALTATGADLRRPPAASGTAQACRSAFR